MYDGVTQVEVPHDPNYHFTVDMTDQAVAWMQYQHSLAPDKPFFMYFAPGATHAPHHVPTGYADRFKGQFDEGWDKMREHTLARQIELGVVPKGTKLAPKPKDIKDWDSLSADGEETVRSPDGSVRRFCRTYRSSRSAALSRHSRPRANWTTRCSSISLATTAPVLKVR